MEPWRELAIAARAASLFSRTIDHSSLLGASHPAASETVTFKHLATMFVFFVNRS